MRYPSANRIVISTGGIMGLRPTQGDEKRLLSEAALQESAALPFVISTEAQRSGEISVLTPFPGNVFRQSGPGFPTTQNWQSPGMRLSVEKGA
jgi:hypothetical protein